MTAKVFEEEPERKPPSVRTRVSSAIQVEEDDEAPVDLEALARAAPVAFALELEPDEEEEAAVVRTAAPPPPAPSHTPILAELLARAAEEEEEPSLAPPAPPPEELEPSNRFLLALEKARLPAANLAWAAVFAGLVWLFGKGWQGAAMMGSFCLILTLLGVRWKHLVGTASVALIAAAGTELVRRWDRFAEFFSPFF